MPGRPVPRPVSPPPPSRIAARVAAQPPVPELQQALQRAHAWAAYAADGRLVRVGGLRGAPAEAREVVADVASQWQWMVPARVGAEAARRERDGAHTLRATYRHLGISRGACDPRCPPPLSHTS